MKALINRLKIVAMRRWFMVLLRHEKRRKSIRPQDTDGTGGCGSCDICSICRCGILGKLGGHTQKHVDKVRHRIALFQLYAFLAAQLRKYPLSYAEAYPKWPSCDTSEK